ncbi:peptidoglycan DD-metalloendopeptidase family protein [Arthrobacter sp. D2-10]
MSEVRPASGHQVLRSRRRAVRSGMSVCLAVAVIYSFGYPGATPLSSGSGAAGTILAQGAGNSTDVAEPPTGFVGEQLLVAPEVTAPHGSSDSLVPGREIPGAKESARARANAEEASVGEISSMGRPGKGMLISPLQFLTPSSPFGLRTSPITGEHGEFHSGQDFAAPCGTRVFSADAGVVRAVGWHPWGGGNRVELDHGNGLVTTYNHLEGVAVETGDRVGAGQVIATVGTTGWSTGCHLHFETILDGAHTDPSAWKLIPLDGSGPSEMPSLVNFTPGTGNGRDGDTAWVAYLASSEPIEPIAYKSPSRVDAEVSALGKRPATGKIPSAAEKSSPGKIVTASPSGTPSTSGTPSSTGTPSSSGTPTDKPGTSTSTPPATKPPVTSTPPTTPVTPPSGETETPSTPPPASETPSTPPPATETPAQPTPPVTVPVPTPPVTDPEPTPPVTDPEPTPTVTDPVVETPADPAPSDTAVPTADSPAPTTPSAAAPETCDPLGDSAADPITIDPETGLAIDPVTGLLRPVEELCDPASEVVAAAP